MIDIADTLARGGRGRIDFLRYCVMSITMDPLFVFLAGEYRLRPTHTGALALYDVFCEPRSPARLSAHDLLPPRVLGLAAEIAQVRERWTAMQAPPAEDDDEPGTVPAGPGRALFEALVRGVLADANGKLARLSTAYDPRLSPHENLPGGKMNASQRSFVDQVWQPYARPLLASAGFWQITTIG